MIGRILKNRYRVDKSIGNGAMGMVYRATDLQNEDVVAVKTITHDYLNDEEVRRRFAREVRILQKLQHQHVIGYVDAFTVGQDAYLVMEYVGGGTLGTLIEQKGQMPIGLFKQLALRIMDAIATAHENGIYHRDLKPANILITSAGVPKIADFGLSKLNEATKLTKTGTLMGTLTYMAPEVLDALVREDHRVDIWAMGVIMYEMLSGGHLPFRGRSEAALITSILNDNPESLALHRRDLPGAWYDIINYCLQKEQSQRYQSMRDVMEDLQRESCRFYDGGVSQPPTISDVFSLDDFDDLPNALIEVEVETRVPRPTQPLAANGYELKYIQAKPTPTAPLSPPKGQKKPERKLPYADPTGPNVGVGTGGSSFGLVVASGLFIWIGILTLIISSAIGIMSITQENGLMPAEVLRMIQAVGALLFVVGVFFELPDTEGWRRIFTMSLAFWAAVIWMVCFSGLVFPPEFLVIASGLVGYALMIIGYFQIQSL